MVVRAGLAQVLREIGGYQVVAEAESGEEALEQCRRHQPDVVVMDMLMPGFGGMGATEAIRREFPETRVVILSAFDGWQQAEQVMQAGASAFLSKSVTAAELVETIARVRAGEVINAIRAAEQPAMPAAPAGRSAPATVLGAQQRKVLALLTKGYTNNEIAAYLGLSMPTARYHVSALLVKLGVSNRAEAAALAIRNRLICDGDF